MPAVVLSLARLLAVSMSPQRAYPVAMKIHSGALPRSRTIIMGASAETQEREEKTINRVRVASSQGPAYICKEIEDFLRPDCEAHPAMCVPRPQTWDDIQSHVDDIAQSGAFGHQETVDVELNAFGGSEQQLADELGEQSRQIVDFATRVGLPKNVGRLIEEDYMRLGMVMGRMLPAANLVIRLEIMGENCCKRWHQDHYLARAIVSYNCCGTEYADHDNVDFWELKHCGNNKCIIKDPSQILSANVGDVLFMKGAAFPCKKGLGSRAKGLVHRSPDPRYHADGNVMNRLLLKVDAFL